MFADLILSSDAVFTGLEDTPSAKAIAIKDNKIIAVDSIEKIRSYIGPETKEYAFKDHMILPGFHDSHIHLMLGSLFTNNSVDLSEAASAEEAVTFVKDFHEKHQTDEWLIGYGWDHTNWDGNKFPTRHAIDQVVADRPVLLFHAEGHYTWVNTKALYLSGVTKDTKDPEAGTIQKDERGELTGILIEKASSLVTDIGLAMNDVKKKHLIQQFLKQAAKHGVTSVNDLYASSFEQLESYDIYEQIEREGELTVRLHLYPELNGDLETAKHLREKYKSKKLQVAGLKQFIDGVVTSHTAVMLDPYTDQPDTYGEPVFSKETIEKWVIEADQEGFQIRFHAIGDGAVRLGLDAFEKAQKENGVRDSRHALEHIEVISKEDLKRFKELGVLPSVQPSHLALMPIESHTTRVKEEKYPYIYMNKSLYQANPHINYGTDYPISPLNPLEEIYYAVTRTDFTGEKPWNENETVSMAEALKAYTASGAYGVFRENELGTISEGKLADLVVLDKNIFEIDPEEIKDVQVEMTIVDGEIIYSKNY